MKLIVVLYRIIIVFLVLVGLATVVLFPKEFFPRMGEWLRKQWGKIKKNEGPKEEQPAGNAKEQFIRNKDKFFGIYENLYLVVKACQEDSQCNLNDWNTRISLLQDAKDLQAYWTSVRERPAEFLAFVRDCGVQRDQSQSIVATEQTRYRYFLLDGSPVETGKTYKVMQPCWTYGDTVLEKGILNNQ